MTSSKSYVSSDKEKKAIATYYKKKNTQHIFKLKEQFPDSPVIHQELGLYYISIGSYKQGRVCFIQNIRKYRNSSIASDAYTNLSFTFATQENYVASIDAAKKALKITPHSIGALLNLGTSYHKIKDKNNALIMFEKAFKLAPNDSNAISNLSALYNDMDIFTKAYNLSKPYVDKGSANDVLITNHIKICTDLGYTQEGFDLSLAFIKRNPDMYKCISSTHFLSNILPYETQKNKQLAAYTKTYFDRVKIDTSKVFHTPKSDKIRIGYISPDIWKHVVAGFCDPLFFKYDKSKFEVILFHYNWFEDAHTLKIYESVDKVIKIKNLSDQELFDAIKAESLDIIIDLAGHTNNNSLPVLNKRPAPVVASYAIGSGTSTFAPNIDYLIADKTHFSGTPPELHTEKLALMSPGFCYVAPLSRENVSPLAAKNNGYITFGSLTRPVRITDQQIEIWSTILKQVPHSKFILDQLIFEEKEACELFINKFTKNGIDPSRIICRRTKNFIASYNDIDIVLDTFPQNSGTTTCDALWMGCPVVTQKGCPPIGQLGASILEQLGFDNLVTHSSSEYIEKTVALASDITYLEHFKSTTRQTLRNSTMMNKNVFIYQFESLISKLVNKNTDTPKGASELITLANQAYKENNHAQCLTFFKQALEIKPNDAEVLHHFSSTLLFMGKIDQAISTMNTMISLHTDHPQLTFVMANLAYAYITKNQFQLAIDTCLHANKIAPYNAFVWSNLGTALAHLNRYDQAYRALKKAIEIDNSIIPALTTLCGVCVKLNKFEEGKKIGEAALIKAPNDCDLLYNYSKICYANHNIIKACEYIKKAIQLKPNSPQYLNQYACYIADLGLPEQALELLTSACSLSSDDDDVTSNLLFVSSACSGYQTENLKDIVALVQSRQPQKINYLPDAPYAHKKIRLAYISADFKNHPVNTFMEQIYANHNHQKFEVFAYSQLDFETQTTQRLKPYFDHWQIVKHLDDTSLMQLIAKDEIDVLIDLTGHTASNRLKLFNHRSAPVQASYIIGSGTTTAMPECDFLIGDKHLFTTDMAKCIPESLAALECGYLYKQPDFKDDVAPAPCIKNGFITFGCLSRTIRLNDQVIDVWSNILQLNPTSKLILDQKIFKYEENIQFFLEKFTRKGVDPDRIVFRATVEHYWKTYSDIDVVLDPFPQNAGTTTFEAIWMGCPVITMNGPAPTGTIGKAVMSHLGMHDWIAQDIDDYITIANQVCHNLNFVADIRSVMRTTLLNSSLMNVQSFIKEYEDIISKMHAFQTNKTMEIV